MLALFDGISYWSHCCFLGCYCELIPTEDEGRKLLNNRRWRGVENYYFLMWNTAFYLNTKSSHHTHAATISSWCCFIYTASRTWVMAFSWFSRTRVCGKFLCTIKSWDIWLVQVFISLAHKSPGRAFYRKSHSMLKAELIITKSLVNFSP